MVGNRAIYHDGWVGRHNTACAALDAGQRCRRWATTTGTYNIAKDYSEKQRSRGATADKLKEMQRCSDRGGKYQVFPLDNSGFVRVLAPKSRARPPGKRNSPTRA